MRSMAALYLDSHNDLSPVAQALVPSSRSATAESFFSPSALIEFQCLISSMHWPLSVWSASAGVEQPTKIVNAKIDRNCFMHIFTKLPKQITRAGRQISCLCYNTLYQLGRKS